MKSFLITPGAEGDLPGIADVLNFTIMNGEYLSSVGMERRCPRR